MAAYTAGNDVSARDVQFADVQWTRGKSFDTFAPMGPWLVTSDELGDISDVRITTLVNGEKLQDDVAGSMVFDVDAILRHLSAGTTLEPGDVVMTGTPSGAGAFLDPPRFLDDGDVVEVVVDRRGHVAQRRAGRVRGAPMTDHVLTLIGAGSAVFTRGLLADLISADDLGSWEIRLVDINPVALDGALRPGPEDDRRPRASAAGRCRSRATSTARTMLPGSDFVVTCLGVGGRPAWQADHEITQRARRLPGCRRLDPARRHLPAAAHRAAARRGRAGRRRPGARTRCTSTTATR